MKRKELAKALARATGIPPAHAQDRVDAVIHDVLRRLRNGRSVRLAQIGKLVGRAEKP